MTQLSALESRMLKTMAAGFATGETTASTIQVSRFAVADAARTTVEVTSDFSRGFKAGFGSKWQELQATRNAEIAQRKLAREQALASFAGRAQLPAPEPTMSVESIDNVAAAVPA